MQKSCQIICSFEKKQYLCIAIKQRAFSSAGSEHLPYKQRVGGSNPSTPTKRDSTTKSRVFFLSPTPTKKSPNPRLSGKLVGKDYALLPNRQWNQKQKPKKQPWGKVECFAFGGATVCFASLETSIHAANHTIPPPPSNEGYPRCPKDKNRSPFHGEKPLMI